MNKQTSLICVCSYVYSYHLHCGIDHVQPKVCSVNVSQKLEWPEFLSLTKGKSIKHYSQKKNHNTENCYTANVCWCTFIYSEICFLDE